MSAKVTVWPACMRKSAPSAIAGLLPPATLAQAVSDRGSRLESMRLAEMMFRMVRSWSVADI